MPPRANPNALYIYTGSPSCTNADLERLCSLCHSVDKRTGQAVAIKIIDIESAEDEVEDIIQEIAILSELQSPFVTKYYGSYAKGAELWIVMEFCSGGSCADLMKPGKIEEEYIAIIVRELLLGLDYLHSDKKLHRDVKGALNLYRSVHPGME